MSNVKTMVNSTLEQDAEKVNNHIVDAIKSGDGAATDFETKQGFSDAMKNVLSTAYAVKMMATDMSKRYKNNVAFFLDKMARFETIEEPTEEQSEELKKTVAELNKSKARWGFWYNAIKKNYVKSSLSVDDGLYKAYEAKRADNDAYRTSLKNYFIDNYDMSIKESTVDYIDQTIGRKRAAMTQADKCQTKAFSKTEYFLFLTDTMIEIAIAKKQMSLGVACEVVKGQLETIDELENIYAVPRRTYMTTIAEMKAVLESVAYEVKGLKTKNDYIEAWKSAVKAGLFVEY